MTKRNLNFLFFLLLFLGSCNFFSKYDGYKRKWTGIYYKLIEIGDDTQKPTIGDYITVDLKYKTLNDSVFFSGKRRLRLISPEYKGSIDECFAMLSKGDKAEFIINAGNFFHKTLQSNLPSFLKADGPMKVEIAMLDFQTEQDYENQKKAFLKWTEDFGNYEKEILSQFIEKQKLPIKPTESGLYFMQIKPGNGRRVKTGDTIIVDYEGRFLDGKFFDSTIKRHESFQFVYGTEWQVIKGLEEAIGMMEEHEKALVIVPSDLAFGPTGSSTGIIPPYTSLIFEVELKKID
jgi:FKBP-type peptidyl-prolyl cis-trans isomerase